MNAFDALTKNSLSMRLMPVSLRELLTLGFAPCDLYISGENGIDISFQENADISQADIVNLLREQVVQLFALDEDYHKVKEAVVEELKKVTRSISIGNQLENVKRQVNLLTVNMSYLYETPTDLDLLQTQYQCAKNLVYFLINNQQLHSRIYKAFEAQNHHYIFAQPLLSSIFLLGILQQTKLMSNKELESLFMTSYFKDIGMSAIPVENYSKPVLNDHDKAMFARHPELSVQLLTDRIPLAPQYLNIIKNHHTFSLLESDGKLSSMLCGFETMLISVTDIIAAMISTRPYREATSLFEALELIKVLISEKYPDEFKYIVLYFKQFFR